MKRKSAAAAANNETDPRSSGPFLTLCGDAPKVVAAPAIFPCCFLVTF